MYVTPTNIITAGAVLGAISAILTFLFSLYKRHLKQIEQEKEIENIKEEQKLTFHALLACLDGLQQLGANHSVPQVKKKLEEYLNSTAHK